VREKHEQARISKKEEKRRKFPKKEEKQEKEEQEQVKGTIVGLNLAKTEEVFESKTRRKFITASGTVQLVSKVTLCLRQLVGVILTVFGSLDWLCSSNLSFFRGPARL
jgi:hypothetical protein